MKQLEGRKIACFTLGCKLNYAETSAIVERLQEEGAETVHEGEMADICLVNTCSVTEVADHKCRQQISKMTRRHPGALVVVTGCYAQLKPEQVAGLDGVDLVLGSEEKVRLVPEIIKRVNMMPEERLLAKHEFHTSRTADIRRFFPSCASGERTRRYPSRADAAATVRSKAWWSRLGALPQKADAKSSSRASTSATSANPPEKPSSIW